MKNETAAIEAPEWTPPKPRLHLDLDEKLVKKLTDIRPGMQVKMLVTGKIESVSFSDSEYSPGAMCVEITRVRMSKDESNPIADMFFEDDGPENG